MQIYSSEIFRNRLKSDSILPAPSTTDDSGSSATCTGSPVSVRIWKGSANEVNAGFPYDLYVSVPKGAGDKLKGTVETQQPLVAPIAGGQKLGVLRVELDGKPYGEYPVVALQEVPLAGILGRGWDSIRLLFKKAEAL